MYSSDEWIRLLDLKPHPEGGYYRETYRSPERTDTCCLPSGFKGCRSIATAIYYLLRAGEISAFHRIRSDEIWHHYAGEPLELHMLLEDGEYTIVKLGMELSKGELPQLVIPAYTWFGASTPDGVSYSLVGCTVAPGFDFRDFELGQEDDLLRRFPQHTRAISMLTRDGGNR